MSLALAGTIISIGLSKRSGGASGYDLLHLACRYVDVVACMKDRALSDTEIMEISCNPWQIFKSPLRKLGIVAKAAAPCSCWMCGNTRKYQGERTVQERHQMQGIEDDMDGDA